MRAAAQSKEDAATVTREMHNRLLRLADRSQPVAGWTAFGAFVVMVSATLVGIDLSRATSFWIAGIFGVGLAIHTVASETLAVLERVRSGKPPLWRTWTRRDSAGLARLALGVAAWIAFVKLIGALAW